MKRVLAYVVLAALVAGGALAAVRWPRLTQVETGRTPEYPDLEDRTYRATPDATVHAVREAAESLGWRVVGSGQGPGRSQLQAHAEPVPGLRFELTVRVQGAGRGRSRVHVLSRTGRGHWDFGENARLIRRLFDGLDRRLATR